METVPHILKELAHSLGTEIKNNRLEIPEKFGQGYCSGFVFNEYIRMFIMHYELKEELTLENPYFNASARMILFKLQNDIPAVLITTSSLHKEAVIPVHTNTATINIEVDANYLKGLFDTTEKSPVLQSLLQNVQSLLFEQMMPASLQKIVDEMMAASVEQTFKLFFLRIKAEELVCRLLMELEKRDEKHLYDLNSQDIQTMYKVKALMLEQLSTPPLINELARYAGMSPTKLKRLFKQIFGNSIFNYYQEYRMKEAAHLLKDKKLSVSDVGYQLGFSNLSHFSRVFKEHIGKKPKEYSRSLHD